MKQIIIKKDKSSKSAQMVQANELRIGNWLMGANGEPLQIDAYGILNISQYETNVEPIPITPEILEKAGAKKLSSGWDFPFNRQFDTEVCHVFVDKVNGDPSDMWVFKILTQSGIVAVNNIYFLHQLQNVIFCNTRQELNIQL